MKVYHPVIGLSNVITRSTCSHLGVISVVSVQGAPGSAGVPLWVPALPRPHCPAAPHIAPQRPQRPTMPPADHAMIVGALLWVPAMPRIAPQRLALPRNVHNAPHCPPCLHCSAAPRSAPQRTSMPFAAGDHKSRPYDRCEAMSRIDPQCPTSPHIAHQCFSLRATTRVAPTIGATPWAAMPRIAQQCPAAPHHAPHRSCHDRRSTACGCPQRPAMCRSARHRCTLLRIGNHCCRCSTLRATTRVTSTIGFRYGWWAAIQHYLLRLYLWRHTVST